MNLEDAETHLPDSINPLSLHIMRLTSGKSEIKNQQKIHEIYFLIKIFDEIAFWCDFQFHEFFLLVFVEFDYTLTKNSNSRVFVIL